ncbi:DUF547 domain-containing protein [Alteriqipengyuania sp. 357]
MQAGEDSGPRFVRFVPADQSNASRLDFTVWKEALNYFVFSMGVSLREGAPSVPPGMGTRIVYGHTSRYRLEGNRVTFSFLEDDVIQSLTDYRQDLQSLGDQIDIAKLPRNEQLAYWINLHNAAIIEQIARNYPLKNPSELMIEGYGLPLDKAPFITVAGVAMSPHDIRTKIVYPNWSDPKVMYGFFRGDIGGPSLRREAFTGANVDTLLDSAAKEFVNSLRGVEKRGSTMQVSRIYEEARPFYFTDWPADLRTHIGTYASEEVTGILAKTGQVETVLYENAIADLANGEKEPGYNYVVTQDETGGFSPKSSKTPANILRMVAERDAKVLKMLRNRDRVGKVYVLVGDAAEAAEPEPEEVE